MSNELTINIVPELMESISQIIVNARRRVVATINNELIVTYWTIGKEIVDKEHNNNIDSQTSRQIILQLSRQLTQTLGTGFSRSNLFNMREMDLILASLLPAVFMFHDFEEIIFMKSWIVKNKTYLQSHFPKISRLILKMEGVSTATFTLGVAEEFVLFGSMTYFSLLTGNYGCWFGLLIAFTLHIVTHIVQFVVVRRHIPCIVTSILALPYCIFTVIRFIEMHILNNMQMIVWSLIMSVIMSINLLLIHKYLMKIKI